MRMINPIKPICENGQLLILGTFPGAESLKAGFYYWHAQNRFWKVLAEVLREPGFLERDKEIRRGLIIKHKIALWDSVESCERDGSLDQNIKNAVYIDLKSFLNSNPSIKRIILNGGKSAQIYEKIFKNEIDTEYFPCPSTSPANARFNIEKWKAALKF